MKFLTQWISVLVLLSLASACQNPDEFYKENKAWLKGYTKTPSGFYYKIHVHGEGDSIRVNDDVYGQLWIAWCDSIVNQSPVDYEHLGTAIVYPGNDYPLTENFLMLRVGDSASFVYPGEMNPYLNDKKDPYFHLCDRLTLTLKIKAAKPNEASIETDRFIQKFEADERKQIKAFMLKNKLTDLLPNSEGVYVQMLERGAGQPVSAGDVVSFQYQEYYLDDPNRSETPTTLWNKLDSLTVYQIKVGQKAWKKGVDQALTGQPKGSKLRLILPSRAAAEDDVPREMFSMHHRFLVPLILDLNLLNE